MSRRTTVALLTDWLENEYQCNLLAGVEETARKHGVNLLCFAAGAVDAPDLGQRQRNFLYDLVGSSIVDGIILMSGTIGNTIGPEGLLRFCERFRPLPMCSIGIGLSGIPSILVDNARGMHALLSHLTQVHEFRRLAFVRGPAASVEAQSRFTVYQQVLEEYGIPLEPDLIIPGDFLPSAGADAVRILIDERKIRVDAVVAASDAMAQGAVSALQARGIRVPYDIAVVGFDDIESSRFAAAPLTTVRQPLFELGVHAMQSILAQLRGESVQSTTILRTHLETRQSCGCPAQTTLPVAHYQVMAPAATLAEALHQQRGLVLSDMAQAARAMSGSIETVWGERLLDALQAELEENPIGVFLSTFEELLLLAAMLGGNVPAWQGVVSVLRHHARSCLQTDPRQCRRAEELLHEARVLISLIAERAQAQHRFRTEHDARVLRSTAKALATALDPNAMGRVLLENLPQLKIKSYGLCRFAEPPHSGARTQLLGAHDATGRGVPVVSRPFPARELVPSGVLPTDRRYTYVVEPLFFEADQMGYVLLEMGPSEGVVYEALRDHLATSLKSASLSTELRRVHQELERNGNGGHDAQVAARIRTASLPDGLTVEGLKIAGRMLAGPETGGDYHDVVPVPGGAWLAIGDVSGAGFATSLATQKLHSIVTTLVTEQPNAYPSDHLRAVNRVFFDSVRRRQKVDLNATLTLLRYDAAGRLVFAGAHQDIVICRSQDGRCVSLKTPGARLGSVRDLERGAVDTHCQLADGDLLFLYTDGATAVANAQGQKLMLARLCEEVSAGRYESVSRLRDRLIDLIRFWGPLQDDATVLVARHGRTSDVLALDESTAPGLG